MTRFESVMAVFAVLGAHRYHVVGLSDQKVRLRYVGDEPFDHAVESAKTVPGFTLRVYEDGSVVARRH